MLHIHNGDASADVLRRSGLAGDHLPWREALVAGPTPQVSNMEEWCTLRSEYLAQAYGLDTADCRAALIDQERKLEEAPGHDQIVLWFEHDLFCQTILIYLLARMGAMEIPSRKISLVCIDRFPGRPRFRGLGELSPGEMASLFEHRVAITPEHFDLALRAWYAYTSSDPTDIERILITDTSPLPFLDAALRAHLRRFPFTSNGLGAVQNRALELIGNGTAEFSALFHSFGSSEPLYGYGDYQFWNDLDILAGMRRPLVTVKGLDSPDHPLASGMFGRSSFQLTPTGRQVLAGREDALAIGGLELWLGGVRIDRSSYWRWDTMEERIVGIH